MDNHATTFLIATILTLMTILLIFGMKYFSASRRARLGFVNETTRRELMEKAAAAQTETAASLAVMRADVAEIKAKLASIEKVLREVE